MPKKSVKPQVWDTPIWEDVIVELTDPRPYEPVVKIFTESFQPDDEPFVDPEYFDHLLYEVAVQGEEAHEAFDGWREIADEAMDKIWAWPVRWSASLDHVARARALTLLSSPNTPTITLPHVGNVNEVTQEIPVVKS